MRTLTLISIAAAALLAGCASKNPAVPPPGPETVRIATAHPGGSFLEIGPVSGVDGIGCGDSGTRGSHDGAVVSLMKNAFAMGGTHVQVTAIYEPRKMGDCFVNIYRITGTAFREAKVATTPARGQAGGDVVQGLRELQKLRDDKVITEPEFERLKARMISGG